MTNICCAIELEPKTLTPLQLTQAREVAIDIVQNDSEEAASGTFLQDLLPVTSVKETTTVIIVQEIEALSTENGKTENKEKMMNIQTNCQCSCNVDLKEPLSAPF